jgi:hypothetical protein
MSKGLFSIPIMNTIHPIPLPIYRLLFHSRNRANPCSVIILASDQTIQERGRPQPHYSTSAPYVRRRYTTTPPLEFCL